MNSYHFTLLHLHTPLCVFMHVWVHMCVCVCRPENRLECNFLEAIHLVSLGQGLPLTWNFRSNLDWQTRKPKRSTCLYLSSTGITKKGHQIHKFLHGFGRLNLMEGEHFTVYHLSPGVLKLWAVILLTNLYLQKYLHYDS